MGNSVNTVVVCLYVSLWWTFDLSRVYSALGVVVAGTVHQIPATQKRKASKENGWMVINAILLCFQTDNKPILIINNTCWNHFILSFLVVSIGKSCWKPPKHHHCICFPPSRCVYVLDWTAEIPGKVIIPLSRLWSHFPCDKDKTGGIKSPFSQSRLHLCTDSIILLLLDSLPRACFQPQGNQLLPDTSNNIWHRLEHI